MPVFEEINKILSDLLDEYGEFIIDELKSNSRKFGLLDKDVKASGNLINSLEKEIVLSSSTGLAQLLLGFEPYGRFSDLRARQTQHTKQPPVDLLAQMIRDKGLEKYKLDRGLRQIQRLRGEDAAIRDLAWRLSKTILNKPNNRKKKRKWRFSKILYGSITNIRKKIAFTFAKEQLEVLNKLSFPEKIEVKI